MSIDLRALERAVARHGRVARVVIVSVKGSAPREVGAAMLVWADGFEGTIGGGALELAAIGRARDALDTGDRMDRLALGPDMGQCCGGAVTLLTEIWDRARLDPLANPAARPLPGTTGAMPRRVADRLREARGRQSPPRLEIVDGWVIEPIAHPAREIWVWGAGHVGRAIVSVLHPLPDFRIIWADVAPDRFPAVPEGVQARVANPLSDLVEQAPQSAEHLVLTFSHALDLDLCHRLLGHGSRSLGLIGSATKWARFRSRLAALGHPPERIGRILCPIGDPSLGKHPQAIAVGVAAALLGGRISPPGTGADSTGDGRA
ncbi:xanthine dehydrogenase accessory factor [Albidovulum inexpectatum]|uniref:Xanthine dehydrogenase accessory factor n=1 Tax=Albidovulum inexpectatum TaxID=196587 RepID=A0A2S5JEK8_9RHOB|nr:xanthine dehydrogenase accessory protein XdhC [Albidovulum inexpectatum]PPB79913.1 xanthine dehydrogenase accessory factor [Albidovulum inexpectatum]